jgi:hypothetical protein
MQRLPTANPNSMFTNDLLKLEQAISCLSYEQQLWLVERIVHNLRVSPSNEQPALNGQSLPKTPPPPPPTNKPAQTIQPLQNNRKALPQLPGTSSGFEGRPTIKELDPSLQAQLKAIDDAIDELDGLDQS